MNDSLTKLRADIDVIDEQLIDLLKKRMDIVTEIGFIKKKNAIEALDSKRWRVVNESRKQFAIEKKLDPKHIEHIWNAIHEWALSIEKKL